MFTKGTFCGAGRAGAHIGTLCEAIHRQQGEVGVRRILGVLSLAKKYGAAAADEACAAALDMGVQEYRFVRRYLERRPQAPLSLQQIDPLIRELVQYRDLTLPPFLRQEAKHRLAQAQLPIFRYPACPTHHRVPSAARRACR